MNNNFYVYFHINPVKQEVFYVGIGHKKRASSRFSRSNWWYNIANKYGYNISIIEKNLTWGKACEREKYYIKLIGRKNLGLGTLVNLTDGGDGKLGCNPSKKTLEKMSLAHKGKKNHFFGKHHSEKTKIKIGISSKNRGTGFKKGHKISKETREKIRKAHIGKDFSEEHKKNIGLAHKGIKHTEKAKKRMSEIWKKYFDNGGKNHMFGRKHTPETKKKISEARKGMEFTEEHKKNLSIALKGKRKNYILNEIQKKARSERQKGEKNHMFGKKVSLETKIKTSESLKKAWIKRKNTI